MWFYVAWFFIGVTIYLLFLVYTADQERKESDRRWDQRFEERTNDYLAALQEKNKLSDELKTLSREHEIVRSQRDRAQKQLHEITDVVNGVATVKDHFGDS